MNLRRLSRRFYRPRPLLEPTGHVQGNLSARRASCDRDATEPRGSGGGRNPSGSSWTDPAPAPLWRSVGHKMSQMSDPKKRGGRLRHDPRSRRYRTPSTTPQRSASQAPPGAHPKAIAPGQRRSQPGPSYQLEPRERRVGIAPPAPPRARLPKPGVLRARAIGKGSVRISWRCAAMTRLHWRLLSSNRAAITRAGTPAWLAARISVSRRWRSRVVMRSVSL